MGKRVEFLVCRYAWVGLWELSERALVELGVALFVNFPLKYVVMWLEISLCTHVTIIKVGVLGGFPSNQCLRYACYEIAIIVRVADLTQRSCP